jgi:hypothetical protein
MWSMPKPPAETVVSKCPHEHGDKTLQQQRVAAVKECLDRVEKRNQELKTKYESSGTEFGDHRREGIQANFEILEQFWSEPKHTRLIDARHIRFCFAYATEAALRGETDISRRIALLGIYLAAWLKLGKDTFLDALRGTPVASSNQQTIVDFTASMGKLGTDRELVLFLSKQIPCSCLDENKKNAKQAPKAGRCSYCTSQDLKLELKKCSQCKSVQYCSKGCQVADWRAGHKKECEKWKLHREQNAALKGMRR